MRKTEAKKEAQRLIMRQISTIGYGRFYEEFVEKVGSEDEANEILGEQMNRVAKLLGFKCAWFG